MRRLRDRWPIRPETSRTARTARTASSNSFSRYKTLHVYSNLRINPLPLFPIVRRLVSKSGRLILQVAHYKVPSQIPSDSMNTHPVIHPRPLPAGNLVHRSSHTFSDSSSSSFDHGAASPLAHKTLKRDRDDRQSATTVVEDEREVSFELNPPSPSRDRSEEMKTLGLGWPSHFPTLPSRDASFAVRDDEPVAKKSDQKILGLGFDMGQTTVSINRHTVAVQSDQESGKSSPPPAYGRAPMPKEEGSSSLAVHTPPTQDIEQGCSASSSQEDTVESMLDLPHSTITRRRRAVEAAATAFGLQIESSPEPDHVVQDVTAVDAGQSDIGQQLIDLRRQLDARDKGESIRLVALRIGADTCRPRFDGSYGSSYLTTS